METSAAPSPLLFVLLLALGAASVPLALNNCRALAVGNSLVEPVGFEAEKGLCYAMMLGDHGNIFELEIVTKNLDLTGKLRYITRLETEVEEEPIPYFLSPEPDIIQYKKRIYKEEIGQEYFVFISVEGYQVGSESGITLNLRSVTTENVQKGHYYDLSENTIKITGMSDYILKENEEKINYLFDFKSNNFLYPPKKLHFFLTNTIGAKNEDYLSIKPVEILEDGTMQILKEYVYSYERLIEEKVNDGDTEKYILSPIIVEMGKNENAILVTPSETFIFELMYIVEPDISLAAPIESNNKNITVTGIEHPSYKYLEFTSKFHDIRLTISGTRLNHDTSVIVYSSNCGRFDSKIVYFEMSGCNLLRRLDSGENEFTIEINNPGECQYLKIIASENSLGEIEEEIIHVSYEYLDSNGIASVIVLCVIILFSAGVTLTFFLVGIRICVIKGHKGCYHIARTKQNNVNLIMAEKSTKRCCRKKQFRKQLNSGELSMNVEVNASINITNMSLEGENKENSGTPENSYLK